MTDRKEALKNRRRLCASFAFNIAIAIICFVAAFGVIRLDREHLLLILLAYFAAKELK